MGGIVYDNVSMGCPKGTPSTKLRTPVCFLILSTSLTLVSVFSVCCCYSRGIYLGDPDLSLSSLFWNSLYGSALRILTLSPFFLASSSSWLISLQRETFFFSSLSKTVLWICIGFKCRPGSEQLKKFLF